MPHTCPPFFWCLLNTTVPRRGFVIYIDDFSSQRMRNIEMLSKIHGGILAHVGIERAENTDIATFILDSIRDQTLRRHGVQCVS